MTDLTFCYQHMTEYDLRSLETLDSADFMDGDLSDEELEIPRHMVPPNPDDADTLPSQVHPSYPYGNPTNLNHPAALPPINGEPGRALYEDLGHPGGGANVALRWKDLGLHILLPVNEEKEEAERAAQARKQANGATQGNQPQGAAAEDPVVDEESGDDENEEEEEEEEEEEDGDEDGNEENDLSRDSFDSAMTGPSENTAYSIEY